jgi:hypothetical protein
MNNLACFALLVVLPLGCSGKTESSNQISPPTAEQLAETPQETSFKTQEKRIAELEKEIESLKSGGSEN